MEEHILHIPIGYADRVTSCNWRFFLAFFCFFSTRRHNIKHNVNAIHRCLPWSLITQLFFFSCNLHVLIFLKPLFVKTKLFWILLFSLWFLCSLPILMPITAMSFIHLEWIRIPFHILIWSVNQMIILSYAHCPFYTVKQEWDWNRDWNRKPEMWM